MIYKILQAPDPALRELSQPVPEGTPSKEFLQLGRDLRDTLRHHGGLGISAIQIGKPWRIIVVDPRCGLHYAALFNPQITWLSAERDLLTEGCLSVGKGKEFFVIPRSKQCAITFTTPKGERKGYKVEGLSARLMQHECDHLNGVLVTDHFNSRLPMGGMVEVNGAEPVAGSVDTCGNR